MFVITRFEGYWFNIARPDGVRLDSSAVPVTLKITSDLLWTIIKSVPVATRLLRCEVVGCNKQFLTHYVGGELVPIPEIVLERAELNEADRIVTVFVKRQVPLSSSHGGQPLHLVFAVSRTGDIALTEPLIVLAKQGKSGSRIKEQASKKSMPISTERVRVREMIALTVCPAGAHDDAGAIAPALLPPAAATTAVEGMLSLPLRALAEARPSRPLAAPNSSNGSAESEPVTPTAALAYALSQAAVSNGVNAFAPSPRPAARALEHAEASPRSTKRSRSPISLAEAAASELLADELPAAPVPTRPVLASVLSSLKQADTAITFETVPNMSLFDELTSGSSAPMFSSFGFASLFDSDTASPSSPYFASFGIEAPADEATEGKRPSQFGPADL